MPRQLLFYSAALLTAAYDHRAGCTFQANQDYSQGEGGPSSPAASSADCCAQCVAAGPAKCFAAVFDVATGGVCWLKTQAQTAKPVWSANLTACWPPSSPAPSPLPPPPPPPLYSVTVVSLPPDPVISFLAGQTAWPQSFNPSWVEPSAGTRGVRGLLVRSQNCSFTPGKCLACNPKGPNDNPFLGSVITFAAQNADGSFQKPYLVFAPEGSHDEKGTEDPRIKYDKRTGLYHLFCADAATPSPRRTPPPRNAAPPPPFLSPLATDTCYGSGGGLCHATTADPTAPAPGQWTRYGVMWAGKSAALLIRDAPPHYLYQGVSLARPPHKHQRAPKMSPQTRTLTPNPKRRTNPNQTGQQHPAVDHARPIQLHARHLRVHHAARGPL